MALKTIAVMSPGNMGSAVGDFLGRSGYDVITCLAGRSDFTRETAARCNIRDAGSLEAMVGEADLILSILDPGKAVMVAIEIAAVIKGAENKTAFADCNAISPATALEMKAILEAAGARFIDVGIIGGASTEKSSPMFCTSGPHAPLMDEMDSRGVKILYVGPDIGQGSAIKICNGAWNKGAFALYTSVMMAAEHYGFTEHLQPRLPLSQSGTVDKLHQAITRLPALSGRYIGEMEQIAQTFESIGLPAGFHEASADLFRLLNSTKLANERREEIDSRRTPEDVLKIITETLEAGKPAAAE